ncbi:hypothetical protein G7Y89_g4984 [Cudoniella acicularis]|uniref:Protein kinase domain-containing protein n=1 Tax=Cudoniella acicularis TaxID=354080 RepID=A0A8H4W3S7_9HELO|nr:hypothetical protein G7Y89_g4984 [Cudoniella acicularis]
MSQIGQRTALHEFFRWESTQWVESVADLTTDEKVSFMPLENLKSYFTANDCRELNKILTEVFKTDFPPVDPDLVLRDHTAIFCILLRIGQGQYIEHFAQYEELSDRRLPFDPSRPPAELPAVDDDPTFLERFCEKQRMYCVPIFDGHMLHKNFGRQRFLPITSKEPREIEGQAQRYIITLYGPHNRLIPPAQAQQMNAANANTFVLKRYPGKEHEAVYREEVNGFRSVKQADSIIKFYGSYIHGDEYNILLEFAEKGTLEQYFALESPPSRGGDIVKFWEALFRLIKGLKAVHSVRKGHLNVNPQSVSVLSAGTESSNWQFKFSDFGLRNAESKEGQDGANAAPENENSPTYSAPEQYMRYDQNDQPRPGSPKPTWAADIWALGCIYSEAAIWIADGYKGLVDYRKQRAIEFERIMFKSGDCFHDGLRVLQSVLDAHRDIEDRLRRSDNITKDVLDSMVDEMLWEEDRPNAKALTRKAEMILSRARQKLAPNSPDDIIRPGSSQSRTYPPPRLQPPSQALPPIPRGLTPALSSISEQQFPTNVDKWRSQVSPVAPRSRFGSSIASESSSPVLPHQQLSSTESVSDLDREITGSIASWNFGDNNSVVAPSTPFTSPHVSVHYDFQGHPNEGRPRAAPSPGPQEYRRPLPNHNLSRNLSYMGSESSFSSTHPPRRDSARVMSSYTQGSATSIPTPRNQWFEGAATSDVPPAPNQWTEPTSDPNPNPNPNPEPRTMSPPQNQLNQGPVLDDAPPAQSQWNIGSAVSDLKPDSRSVLPSQRTGGSVVGDSRPEPRAMPPVQNHLREGSAVSDLNSESRVVQPTQNRLREASGVSDARLESRTRSPSQNHWAGVSAASDSRPDLMAMPPLQNQRAEGSIISDHRPESRRVPTAENAWSQGSVISNALPAQNQWTGGSVVSDIRPDSRSTLQSQHHRPGGSVVSDIRPESAVMPQTQWMGSSESTVTDGSKTASRAPSRGSSRHSTFSLPRSTHSDDNPPAPTKSQKRSLGFSLFPSKSRSGGVPPSPSVTSLEKHFFSRKESVSSSHSSRHPSTPSERASPIPDLPQSNDYLSVNTCLQWKIAHKTVKKSSKIPPLPGVSMLQGIKERDHVFIIDDSACMSPVWPDVKRVFEALSYVVKGMSPDGTELFFTIAYDTWQRRDTSDLCMYLDKKAIAGVTNITKRLNLQLQAYRMRMNKAKELKGAKSIVRPMSFYILTNGEWPEVPESKVAIKAMADFLIAENLLQGQVTIEFISFAQTATAVQKVNDLAKSDYGLQITDCTPWTGNVLKMLAGPLDRSLFENDGREIAGQRSISRQPSISHVYAPGGGNVALTELA